LHVHEVPAMRVPGGILSQVDLYEVDAPFDEPLGHQDGESEFVLAVAGQRLCVGIFHFEGAADASIRQHRKGLVTMTSKSVGCPVQIELLALNAAEKVQSAGETWLAAVGQGQSW